MIGYLDLPSGLSGDMFLGCLVDAGWPVEELRAVIGRLKLPPAEWSIEARAVMKGPLRATLVTVHAAGVEPAPAIPAGTTFSPAGDHDHGPAPHHHHHHGEGDHHAHGPAAHAHHGPHRHLADIRALLQGSDLPAVVQERALAVFGRLAQAEAKVHGTTPDKIHFHEVGAVDAIIDIVGSVAGVQALGIEPLHASAVPLGEGWTRSEHGRIPLPAPATLELLAAVGAPTRPAPGPQAGELVTPTGAALLAELARFSQPEMELARIGQGAGQRDCAWPNLARLWLGQGRDAEPLVQLETNIDDMNPQFYESVCQGLLAGGALDVWLTPVQMKKGRPGVVLSVLAPARLETALGQLLLRQTTTLGVRVHRLAGRIKARRELRPVATPFGAVTVKLRWVGDDLVGASPEYEDCRRLAESRGVPVRAVHEAAQAAATAAFGMAPPAVGPASP